MPAMFKSSRNPSEDVHQVKEMFLGMTETIEEVATSLVNKALQEIIQKKATERNHATYVTALNSATGGFKQPLNDADAKKILASAHQKMEQNLRQYREASHAKRLGIPRDQDAVQEVSPKRMRR